MAKFLGVFLLGIISLTAVEIPLDEQVKMFTLHKGIQIWLKEQKTSPTHIGCRFVGQDPLQGKPQIYDLDCPAEVFEADLPGFLDYCEEEIQKKGGVAIGLVAVGSMDSQGLHHYLKDRYDQSGSENETSVEHQLIPSQTSKENDVFLSYPAALTPVKSDTDLKNLWVFYLIQSMAENRFKKATVEVDGKWIVPEEGTRYLLPALATVAHGVETIKLQDRLLKSFLQAIQVLKERGFTDSELADSKTHLIKHLKRFYETTPSEKTLADFYASHLAASLQSSEYEPFMTASLLLIPEINMGDIAKMLKVSFKDETRQVVIHHPKDAPISMEQVRSLLKQFESDSLKFEIKNDKVILVEGKDSFSQLLITDEEQMMIREVIHTVAESNVIKLGWIRSDLEKKRLQLLHIHPLRSLATMFTDPYTKECVAEIMGDLFKRPPFIKDFAKRFSTEAEQNNLLTYAQGFSLAVKANPEQVRIYLNNKEWEKLIKYLILVNAL